jgi:metal-responsive CopG/Arc/MetJ family transcriptional regulator
LPTGYLAKIVQLRYAAGMAKDTPEPKDQRVPIMMTASELQAVDDWSFEHRIRSRGEAIRQLIRLGLKAAKSQPSGKGRTR